MNKEKSLLFHKGQGSSNWRRNIGRLRFVYVIAFSVRRSSFGCNHVALTMLSAYFYLMVLRVNSKQNRVTCANDLLLKRNILRRYGTVSLNVNVTILHSLNFVFILY